MARSLNAPFGARCFMTYAWVARRIAPLSSCLNAPFGARCFMTVLLSVVVALISSKS